MAEAMDQDKTIEYFRELIALDQAGERTTVVIGPWAAMSLIIMLQLSLRHPEVSTSVKNGALDVLGQLETLFTGTYGEKIIAAGYDTSQDVPRG